MTLVRVSYLFRVSFLIRSFIKNSTFCHEKLLLFILLSILTYFANAQSFGIEADNYSGVQGVIFNPANVTDSRFKADINLFSNDIFLGNDYIGITLSNITKIFDDNFKFKQDIDRFSTDKNNFLAQVNILDPSFMFNLNKKSSIAFTTRVRSLINIHNISGELLENIIEGFDSSSNTNFDFDMSALNTTLHTWGEIGLTYGRTLVNNKQNYLKAGATVKYIIGAGLIQGSSNNAQGNFNATQDLLTTTGNLVYRTTLDIGESYSFKNTSSGFGADIGVVYEWRPDYGKYDAKQNNYKVLNKYKLKLGVSLTDIGSVTYNDVRVTNYNLNNTINTNSVSGDFEQFLNNNYANTKTTADVKIKLPTAIRVNVDYKIINRIYASVNYVHSLNNENEILASKALNVLSIIPRYESKRFGFYLPVSFSEFKGTNVGVGLRLGFVTIGSSSIISNLISKDAKSLQIYTGIRIPILQQSKIKRRKQKVYQNRYIQSQYLRKKRTYKKRIKFKWVKKSMYSIYLMILLLLSWFIAIILLIVNRLKSLKSHFIKRNNKH